MAIPVSNVSQNSTFGAWLQLTNVLAAALSANNVTVGGVPAVGNAYVTGMFFANTLSANQFTGQGNVHFTSAQWIFDTSSTLLLQGSVDFQSNVQFDSVSNITMLGASANTPLVRFLSVNPSTNKLQFEEILIPSTQLTDFGTANGTFYAANCTILVWSGSNSTNGQWVTGDIRSIPQTTIANLAIGAVTSNATFNANVNVGSNTFWVNTTTGRVGVGTGTPAAALGVNGTIYATGDVQGYQTSDKTFKEHITSLRPLDELDKVMLLRPVEFDWIEALVKESLYVGDNKRGHDWGLIAQELQRIFPQYVKTRPDGTLAVDAVGLIPHLIAAIQGLGQRLGDIETRLSKAGL